MANGEIDLNEWILIYQDELVNNIIYKNSNLDFTDSGNDHYNDIDTTSIQFTASILRLEHEGVIHFFHKGDKTFALLKQQVIEDNLVNKPDFDLIEENFRIN